MVELFDPRKMVTDYDREEDCCDHCDFAFAFAYNDPNFSDRVLRIHILSGPIESTPATAKTLHINSLILAARSSFFHKLFSNGMRESTQRFVTLQISASEEAAFMELLNFMYSSKLTVTTAQDVLHVLKAADKFEVASCVRRCSRLLRNLPMTPESVLVYLHLPKTILTSEAFQPLTIAAKQFYAIHYKDIAKFRKETLGLPLASVETILASDDLRLNSENVVYRFVLDWTLAHYPDYKERRDIIATRLAKFIRFPYMTRRMLAVVLTCPDFNPEFAQKVVKEALSFKAEVPTMEHTYIRDEYSILNRWFVARAYKGRPIKMVEYEQPIPHCVVYFDLKCDVCASLFPSGMVKSEVFSLGSHRDHLFCLVARCNTNCFGLYVCMLDDNQGPESVLFAFEYELAAMSKRTNEFVSRKKGLCTFSYKWAIGIHNMFAIPWSSFIGEDSVYFVDGVLHLRAELTQLS